MYQLCITLNLTLLIHNAYYRRFSSMLIHHHEETTPKYLHQYTLVVHMSTHKPAFHAQYIPVLLEALPSMKIVPQV